MSTMMASNGFPTSVEGIELDMRYRRLARAARIRNAHTCGPDPAGPRPWSHTELVARLRATLGRP